MVSVLITRPQAVSLTLATELKRHGYMSFIEPMLKIVPAAGTLPNVNPQAVMITSVNALDTIAADRIPNLLALPCFCVGARSSEKAKQFGFRHVKYSVGDGAELAQLISNTLTDKSRAILHIAGRDTASGAQDDLRQVGFEVAPWVVYTAQPVTTLTSETIKQLENQKLDAVLLFSKRSAETFVFLMKKHKLEAYCKTMAAIGLSKAVTAPLRSLKCRVLTSATIPSEDAMIECLKLTCPV